jgi:tetratricopeptide (TPR) repeat protein
MEPGIIQLEGGPWGYLACAWFCVQSGDKDRACDLFTAARDVLTEWTEPDKELLGLRDKVAAALYADQAGPPEMDLPGYVKVYDRLLATYPTAAAFYPRRGVWAARVCRWEQTSADFRKAMELRPGDASNWYYLALVSLYMRNMQEYEQTCRAMYAKFAESTVPFERHLLMIACLLSPSSGIDPEKILELANRPDRVDDGRMGLALYRCGRFEEARSPGGKQPDATIMVLLEYRSGK